MLIVHDTLLDVPLDEPDVDGDDRLVPAIEGVPFAPPIDDRLTITRPMVATAVAPFFRIEPRDSNYAVVMVARGLWRADFLYKAPGVPFTRLMGPAKVAALNKFKRVAGLPANGIYDRLTHSLLTPYFDAVAIHLGEIERLRRAQEANVTKEQRLRAAVVASLIFLYNNRYRMPYNQQRPWPRTRVPMMPPGGLDCSSGKAWGDYNAGAPEPSGFGSWGYGNTTSQLAHYRAVGRSRPATVTAARSAKVADPFYYDGHVTVKVGDDEGGTTRVWSNGHYPCGIYPWDYRRDVRAVCDLV